MSDIVKAALIIGVAIILSQGFYLKTDGDGVRVHITNKFTGNTMFCYGNRCKPTKFIKSDERFIEH
jgi:hypothetical protein